MSRIKAVLLPPWRLHAAHKRYTEIYLIELPERVILGVPFFFFPPQWEHPVLFVSLNRPSETSCVCGGVRYCWRDEF